MPEHHATGSCLCGAVRHELRGPFSHVAHCHITDGLPQHVEMPP